MEKTIKISELIIKKRNFLNESQSKFGKRFGLSHAAISDLENGKTKSIEEDMLNFVINHCVHDWEVKTYLECVKCRDIKLNIIAQCYPSICFR